MEGTMMETNLLYYGGNLDLLPARGISAKLIGLVYLELPLRSERLI
jgi:hypothetical protein